MFLIEGI